MSAILLGVVFGAERLRAQQPQAEQKNLQLEVFVNNAPTNVIGSFVQFTDGRIGATQHEIGELGFLITATKASNEIIMLDDIPSVKYDYNEREQRIRITADDKYRQGRIFDLRKDGGAKRIATQTGWGSVLNYDLFTTTNDFRNTGAYFFSGTSLTLDARAFSPYGTLSQSGILRSSHDGPADAIRLDTSFRYSDEEKMITYKAGDTINGGLPWSRPIRIAGIQAQSNFALRPDLVTVPLPSLSGTAAVPSTVDVYVNNIRTFSQNVGAGPFSLNGIPVVSGAGNVQLVVRESSGQETRSTLPFYASPALLAPGLSSWSIDAGLPRLSYGSVADVYGRSPVISGTLRRGIYDDLTVETHAEAGSGLANGGVGAVFKTGSFGAAATAISASTLSGTSGMQAYLGYETRVLGLGFNTSIQRTFGSYDDLASATAQHQYLSPGVVQNPNGQGLYSPIASQFVYLNAKPAREIARVTVGAPLFFDLKSSWSASFTRQVSASENLSKILSASYSRSLPFNASLYTTVFRDIANKNTGILVGLTVPFGDSASLSTNVSSGQGGTTATVEAVKTLGPTPGSVGWRVRDSEGPTPYREASFSYRSKYATVDIGAGQLGQTSRGSLELRGSLATMGGGVFFANRIEDAFAVVDVGTPGIEVLHDNRSMGVTDSQGLLLVPTLRSYQKNKIAIDPRGLPVDAELTTARDVVAPADRSGVHVDFKVRRDSNAALVTFVRPGGALVPAGASGRLSGETEFVVGYDGQAFVKGLRDENSVVIDLVDGSCRASFPFIPRPGEQVAIGPITCQ